MVDKSTVGVTAEPEEVEAALRNLCGYHLSERDPLLRYTALTREQVLYDCLVAAIKRERGRALAELAASGQKLTQIAAVTNLTSRQQVQRLIGFAKAADVTPADVPAASRDFEDRLAAVEATLDEVVSGIAPTPVPDSLTHLEPVTEATPVLAMSIGASSAASAQTSSAASSAASSTASSAASAQASSAAPGVGFGDLDDDPYGWSDLDNPDDSVFLEPTRFMPALRGVLQPTKEMPQPNDEVPWWRRGREGRDAKDSGAA